MKKIITLVALAFSLTSEAITSAPINPAFLQWQRERKAAPIVTNRSTQTSRQAKLAAAPAMSSQSPDSEFRGMGLRPSPLDLSYLKDINAGALKAPTAEGFPKRYDLRTEKLLTSIKDQNPYGTCWAHATCASLESWALKSEGRIYDFSEKNMANLHGFDWGFDDGGNWKMAAAYLLRWFGPVDETRDPYSTATIPSLTLSPTRHVQSVKVVPGRINAFDNDRINLNSSVGLPADAAFAA